MIRPCDYEIEIGQSDRGTFVRVKHKPTGNERVRESVPFGEVGKAREVLIAELRSLVVNEDDVRFDIGHAHTGGDFLCVTHLPSGISRHGLAAEGATREDLLDQVLEELVSG
jgi:hypothetical protein